MAFSPDPDALARLRTAHAHMRSALAILDLEEGTGYPAAHLDHAICLLEDELGLAAGERNPPPKPS